MSTHKDEKNGTWYVMVRYHDWKGVKRQKCKRGFATRREAQEWERNFQLQTDGDPDMCGRLSSPEKSLGKKQMRSERNWPND